VYLMCVASDQYMLLYHVTSNITVLDCRYSTHYAYERLLALFTRLSINASLSLFPPVVLRSVDVLYNVAGAE
jgi:hypothetical protein